MTSWQPTDTAEQDSEARPLPGSHDLQLDPKSVVLLTAIQRLFPWLMPQKARLRVIDKICIHAAVITRARGDVNISVDDLLIAMQQSLPPGLVERMYAQLKVPPETRTAYGQRARELDHVSLEALLADLHLHAQKCGAKVCEDKLLPILDCYRDIFEQASVYLKTTTKPVSPSELYVRAGHSAKWFELAAIAKEAGLVDLYENPGYQAYVSVCRRVAAIGSMADISVEGEIQKFYAFFVPTPQTISRLKACKNLPASIFKNAALLESWGFKRFSIFGVDFRNHSMNFYYYTDQTDFGRAKIQAMLSALGFPLPAEEILEQMEAAAMVYFTFTYASDRIERICFTRVYEDDMEPVARLAPAFREYAESAPVRAAKRALLLGFAFNRKGHYLKLELDYKASLGIPKMMKYTGLYSNPDEF